MQRGTSSLYLIVIWTILLLTTSHISNAHAAPNARDDSLGRALGLGLIGAETGLVSTLDGIQHPKTPGTEADTRRASAEAGENVGGSFGTALRGL